MAELEKIEIERTHGNCKCDGCGVQTFDMDVIKFNADAYGAVVCLDCMAVVAKHCAEHFPATPEETRLRARVAELEGALIRMVNMAEQSGLTVFNNEFEAVKWARHILKSEGNLPEAGGE